VFLLVITLFFSLACVGPSPAQKPVPAPTATRVAFFQHRGINQQDQITIEPLCKELGGSVEIVNYKFVNDETKWFDEKGQRKFDIFILPGGDSWLWFEKIHGVSTGVGIDERGCQNIKKFIRNGGSCIGFCFVGPEFFARTSIWTGLTGKQVDAGVKWAPFVNRMPGVMLRVYGIEPIFRGTVMGPQESNLPYPRARFLSIRLDMENSIVKKAKLADTVYLFVAGGGSLIPHVDQQIMEVVGWFPNGTAAIAIVKYGNGHLYMVAPHPNITLGNSSDWIKGLIAGKVPRRFGLNDQQINEAVSILDKEGDLDGPAPDLMLTKAILKDAAERASPLAR
jgi:glutamine amidotransferase-like uncharacterized protein